MLYSDVMSDRIALTQIIYNRLAQEPGQVASLEQCETLHSRSIGTSDYLARLRGAYEVIHSVPVRQIQAREIMATLLFQGLKAVPQELTAIGQTTFLLGVTACYKLSAQLCQELALCLQERSEDDWENPGAVAECYLKLALPQAALPFAHRELQLATSPTMLSLANLQLGRIYLELTQYSEAEEAFLQVIESGISHRWAARELCDLCLSQTAFQKALELAQKMLAEDEAEPFLTLKSKALAGLGEV